MVPRHYAAFGRQTSPFVCRHLAKELFGRGVTTKDAALILALILVLTWGGLSRHAGTMVCAMRVEYPGATIILLRQSYGGTSVMDRGDRRERSAQLRRSGMFIAPASKQIRLTPHWGGMVRSGEGQVAPTKLERIIGGTANHEKG